jgi:hypothetical protein
MCAFFLLLLIHQNSIVVFDRIKIKRTATHMKRYFTIQKEKKMNISADGYVIAQFQLNITSSTCWIEHTNARAVIATHWQARRAT